MTARVHISHSRSPSGVEIASQTCAGVWCSRRRKDRVATSPSATSRPRRSGAVIAEVDAAVAEHPRLGELQVRPVDALEHRSPRAEHEREHEQLVLVDEPPTGELRDDRAAAHDDERLAVPRLERANRVYVPLDAGVAPAGL